jgi:hypothetical protein
MLHAPDLGEESVFVWKVDVSVPREPAKSVQHDVFPSSGPILPVRTHRIPAVATVRQCRFALTDACTTKTIGAHAHVW